jgi:lipopolysaccharide/colanic/teichoic acid biosynthesis glycosyltransferase
LRRLFEICAASAALLLLAPVMLAIAAAVLLDDGMPVFYRQKRIGKNGRPFFILKFRTMRTNVAGSAITASNDRRVTRSGAFLRKLKLDELPQLFNVLSGEMSLIGPRPEVPRYVDLQDPAWHEVLGCAPGITDLATLAFRNEEEILGGVPDPDSYYRSSILPAKLRLNVRYQKSRTPARDLKLLWLTARYSFFPRGYDRERILRSLGA